MKSVLIFVGGFVAGILCSRLALVLFAFYISPNIPNISDNNVQEVQYVEVCGKKGDVTLHTGMFKDSVLILVGKPSRVNLMSIGEGTLEDWYYDLKGGYSNLRIKFEDGKLTDIFQH